MMSRWNAALLAGSAMIAFGGAAIAQTQPQPAGAQPAAAPPTLGATPVYNPDQLPMQRGQVQQFTLTPRGDIDGLILTDGTEVVLPPHLSTQIAYAIKPGDTVLIHGLHAAALPLIQAVSITDDVSGRTVVDNGPPAPGPGPAPPPPPAGPDAGPSAPIPGLSEIQGRVRMVLHGPRGDVNGALLEDGTILRLPPPEANRFASLLQPGQSLVAEGDELTGAIGKVVAVRQLGASRTQLSLIEGPPGPRPAALPPPPDGPAAPPPPRP
jgi:hypothetical protein